MRHTITRYCTLISVFAAVLCTGCATMSEAEREARDYARVEFQEQFRIDRADCRDRGGQLVFQGGPELDRDGVPKTRVWYSCV